MPIKKHIIVAAMALIAPIPALCQTATPQFDAKTQLPVVGDTVAEPTRLLARNCFTAAPMQVIPLIPRPTRSEMLEYHDAGINHPSYNVAGGECIVDTLTDDIVNITSGNGMAMQIFVLNPADKLSPIGVIETIDTPIADSNMHIYSTKWQQLDAKTFTPPTLYDWLKPDARKNIDEIERAVPFVMATYSYSPADGTLTLTNNMQAYYVDSDQPAQISMLQPTLQYKWTGKRFKLIKPKR